MSSFWLLVVWSIILDIKKQNYKTIKYFSTGNKRESKYTPGPFKPQIITSRMLCIISYSKEEKP